MCAVADVLPLSPADAIRRWPGDVPLAALCTGATGQPDSSGWTILARPTRTLAGSPSSFDQLRSLLPTPESVGNPEKAKPGCPFHGGWIGWMSYDLAALVEPACLLDRAGRRRPPTSPHARLDRDTPTMCWHRCNDALIFDHTAAAWHSIGSPPDLTTPRSTSAAYSIGDPGSNMGQAQFEHAAATAVSLIRDGDVYQVNLSHRLTASFEGSSRDLFAGWLAGASPWYGALIEHAHTRQSWAVASMSPELFLQFDPVTRRVWTRPMKGTRPAARSTELLASAKDSAELAMIVDLMRNDLGRICELGSIRVENARVLERHAAGSIAQTTATVSGMLREGISPLDALLACFPAGSVTGAPKIRAMQIIDELEPVRRGPYCGAVGYVSDSGHAAFSVAIRTAVISQERTQAGTLTGGTLDYHAGAGIVADSHPGEEWAETLDKAAILGAIPPSRV